jgi:Maltokinase N-terminal cap domain
VSTVDSGAVALLHQATIIPKKLDALAAWLPGQPWLDGADVSGLIQVGSYRFDDPAGAVGVETLLVRTADERLLQVPLSYRAAPLANAEDALVTTMQHSVLGPRWAYDGCADPVAMRALAAAILTGGHEAELELDTGTGLERREPTVRVVGSGTPPAAVPELAAVAATDGPDGTVVSVGAFVLTVRRRLDRPGPPTTGAQTLYGTWAGTGVPVLLATARPA